MLKIDFFYLIIDFNYSFYNLISSNIEIVFKMVHRTNNSTAPCIMCIGFFGVLFFILSIFGSIIPLINFYNLEQDQCNVTNVEYPTSLPTEEDTSNWVECDCGRHCMSWSPCIKIYTDDDNTNYVLEDIYSSSFENCTFYDDYCLESEDVVVLQEQEI